jgi:DNA-binding XRE family transcriptional regulator
MAQSQEIKLADNIITAVENHWFNPAVVARQLSNQPLYTLDRVMEILSYTIHAIKQRYDDELERGQTTEGLTLANNLDRALDITTDKIQFNNLKLPC